MRTCRAEQNIYRRNASGGTSGPKPAAAPTSDINIGQQTRSRPKLILTPSHTPTPTSVPDIAIGPTTDSAIGSPTRYRPTRGIVIGSRYGYRRATDIDIGPRAPNRRLIRYRYRVTGPISPSWPDADIGSQARCRHVGPTWLDIDIGGETRHRRVGPTPTSSHARR